MTVTQVIKSLIGKAAEFLRPDIAGPIPVTMAVADEFTENNSFATLLSYRFFDTDYNICYLDEGTVPAVGFALKLEKTKTADNLLPLYEDILEVTPADSLIQFACLANSGQNPSIDGHYFTWRKPYTGAKGNPSDMRLFVKDVLAFRDIIQSIMLKYGVASTIVEEGHFKTLVRFIVNPGSPNIDDEFTPVEGNPLFMELVSPHTSITLQSDGRFLVEGAASETVTTALMADYMPATIFTPLGLDSKESILDNFRRENTVFWAFVLLQKVDNLQYLEHIASKFNLNKINPDSAWFKAMTGINQEHNPSAKPLAYELREDEQWVSSIFGVTLFTNREAADSSTKALKKAFNNAGFRLAEEAYISLPSFVTGLPLQQSVTSGALDKRLKRSNLIKVAVPSKREEIAARELLSKSSTDKPNLH